MLLFVPCAFSSTNNFAHAQTLSQMSSLCRSYEHMNIARVNIGVLIGWKKIKQRHISFVLGYLHMILWKISTAINIKHRILATFNIKINSILTAFKSIFSETIKTWLICAWCILIYYMYQCLISKSIKWEIYRAT